MIALKRVDVLKSISAASAGLAIVLCSGCGGGGPPTYPVSGSVVYDGKPVPTGMVALVPAASGPRATGAIAADGSFTLEAPAGDYKVAVLAPRETSMGDLSENNWVEAFRKSSPEPYVPGLYSDPETTPLSFTVTPDGENLCTLKIEPIKRRRR